MVVDAFMLIKNRQWNELASLLSTPEGQRLAKQSNELGELPLHFALWVRAPDYIIANIMASNESAMKNEDNDKWLPLHHATFRDASPAIIESLIRAYPEALDKHNNNGDTPRHIIEKNSKSCVKSKELVSRSTPYWSSRSESSTASSKSFAEKRTSPPPTAEILHDLNATLHEHTAVASMSISEDLPHSDSKIEILEKRLTMLEASYLKSLQEQEKTRVVNEKLIEQNRKLEQRLVLSESVLLNAVNDLTKNLKSNEADEQRKTNKPLVTIEEREQLRKSVQSLSSGVKRVEDMVNSNVCSLQDQIYSLKETIECNAHGLDQKLILTSKTIVDTFRSELRTGLQPVRDNMFRLLCKIENTLSVDIPHDLRSVVTTDEC